MRMRTWCLYMAVCCLWAGGCGTDPAGRIAALETAVGRAESALAVTDQQLAGLQTQLAAAQAAGADSKTLAAITAALDEARARKPDIERFLTDARASLDKAKQNPTMGGEVELYASLAVSALGVFGSAWFRRRAKTVTAALSAVAAGVERAPPDQAATVKDSIGDVMRVRGIYDKANALVDAVKG